MNTRSNAALLISAATLVIASSAHAASISLTNGDFESPAYGDWNWGSPGLTGWSHNSGAYGVAPTSYGSGSQSVLWAWSYGWYGLSQNSTYTVGAAGEEITAGIYARADDVGTGQATIRLTINLDGGEVVANQVGITTSYSPWTLYTVSYTTTASDIGKVVGMGFGSDGGYNTGGASSYTYLDNASLSVVPEPGSAFLGGLGLLALLRRRRA